MEDQDWPKIRQVVAEVHPVGDRVARVCGLLRDHGFNVSKQVTNIPCLACTTVMLIMCNLNSRFLWCAFKEAAQTYDKACKIVSPGHKHRPRDSNVLQGFDRVPNIPGDMDSPGYRACCELPRSIHV